MKIIEYRENRKRGRNDFPLEYHHVTPNHPRYAMPHHWHEETEIIRILSGSFKLTLDEHERRASAGDCIFINGGTLHGGIPEDCIYDCIVLDYEYFFKGNVLFKTRLAPLFNHSMRLPETIPAEDTKAHELLRELFSTVQSRQDGYEFQVIGLLSLLTGHFLKMGYYEPAEKRSDTVLRLQSVKKVLDYIETHYSEPIRLSDLSSLSGMSPGYFCRYFKEMTYRTPIDYLNYYRIEVAVTRLLAENASVTEVAYACGYNELNYFIRCFKKYKGISPKQYVQRPFRKEDGT